MDPKGNCKSDLKLPEDTPEDAILSKKIKESIDNGREVYVTVLAAMGIEKISEFKEVTS